MKRFKNVAFDGKEWPAAPHDFRLVAPIGMADDPENQVQQSVSLDFSSGGPHLLLGTVSTGKSTFLQTVVYSLAALYTPNLLNIYCLDFSGKLLSVFDHLKHVVKPPVMPESRVKGRGLMYCGERILEFQTALAARAEGAPERNDLLREAVQRMNAAWR